MGLFSRKPAYCTICNKQITAHKYKEKTEWYGVKSPLCSDCHLDKMQEHYDATLIKKCMTCGVKSKVTDLWEPRLQWDMEGLLCKKCFDEKELEFNKKRDFCGICGNKLGFIRYNPKNHWKIKGQLCKNCWDEQKAQLDKK